MTKNLGIITWNVNGILNPIKRKKCLSYLKSQGADVAFLQEVHLIDKEAIKQTKEIG